MERVFAEGAFFKPKPQAPDWVVGQASFKVDDFIKFLKEHENEKGYVNLDLKKSKGGDKTYFELDTWQPEKQDDPVKDEPVKEDPPVGDEDEDDLPF